MNGSDDLPTIGTYYTILEEFFTAPDCYVWAMPMWLQNLVTVLDSLFIILYIYIMVIIIKNFKKLDNPFYVCTISMSACDGVILIMGLREGRISACVLGTYPDRQLAWQAFGTLGLDGTLCNGLVLALTRFVTIFYINRSSLHWRVAKIGVVLAWIWTVTMAVLQHLGFISRVWFVDGVYHDKFLFPFQYVHIFALCVCVLGVLLIYILCFVKLVRLRSQASINFKVRKELLILVQCMFIFTGELTYLYGIFWVGSNYLNLGTGEENARLSYVCALVLGGMNPFLYLAFSSQVREMAFPCIKSKSAVATTRQRSIRPFSQQKTTLVAPV